jgi:hypothetical protein
LAEVQGAKRVVVTSRKIDDVINAAKNVILVPPTPPKGNENELEKATKKKTLAAGQSLVALHRDARSCRRMDVTHFKRFA